jgi:hypothetical protein
MEWMTSSVMMPGPLGILPTNPSAAAPWRMAMAASSELLIQQILTRVVVMRER